MIEVRGKVVQGWCQGCSARDAAGECVGATDRRAVAWCLDGAFMACGVAHGVSRADCSLCSSFASVGIEADAISGWNDTKGRTQAEVLALLDRAIEACDETLATTG